MIVMLILVLVLAAAATGAAGWTLVADGPGSDFLRAHLPQSVLLRLLRVGDWFNSGEVDPVTKRLSDAGGEDPGAPPAMPRPSAPPPPLPPPPTPPVPGTAAHARAGIPPDHARLHERIATFTPEDDAALLAFYAGEAAGALGQAEAWIGHCDLLFHEVGLDPVFVRAAAMLAEADAEKAYAFAMVSQRLGQVYALPQAHAAEGGTFPVDADSWFSGEVF